MKKYLIVIAFILLVTATVGFALYASNAANDIKTDSEIELSGLTYTSEGMRICHESEETSTLYVSFEEIENNTQNIIDEETRTELILLEEYWAKQKEEKGADIDVCDIYQGAAELLSSGKPVVFNNNKYVSYFYTLCPKFYSKKPDELFAATISVEGSITTVCVEPNVTTEYDIYMVFLASLSDCFSEYLYDRGESDGDGFSSTSNTRLFFMPDIKTTGYEDVKSYYQAVMEGKTEYTDKSCSINYKVPRIAKCVDTNSTMRNIYEEIRDNYFKQGQEE